MQRIAIFLEEELGNDIRNRAKDHSISVSECAVSLIKLGLKVKALQEKSGEGEAEIEAKDPFLEKHSEYLLRILNICSEILRCTHDPKRAHYQNEKPDDVLEQIKDRIQNTIKQEAVRV